MSSPPIVAEVIEESPRAPAEASAPRSARQIATGPAVRVREFAAIALMIALADVTLYWGHGYAGIGAFLLASPLIFLLGLPKRYFCKAMWIPAAVLVLIVARVVWFGSPLRAVCGFAVLAMVLAAMQAGRVNFGAWLLPWQAPVAGVVALAAYLRALAGRLGFIPKGLILGVGIPAAALLAFSTLFVLANPDVLTVVSDIIGRVSETLREWMSVLSVSEVFVWMLTALLTAGLLRPLVQLSRLAGWRSRDGEQPPAAGEAKQQSSTLYSAYRNALISVIVLFSLYLMFEFKTLWFREFPLGFYYAGYAHQGAFWLTVALALATGVLSVIFRGTIFTDPRLPTLRRLAWAWSGLNLLLAIAVYNRLFIYINFNGLTHMRIVGILGISAVVAGFVLVVWKIARRRNFLWLLNRQSWVLAAAVLIYAMLPVDMIAVSYNVRRVMAGDVSAIMQIGVKPIDDEGTLALLPLLECEHPDIHTGVRALLAERHDVLRKQAQKREWLGWTASQGLDDHAMRRLNAEEDQWSDYEDPAARNAELQRFYDFAYQWY